LSAAVSCLAIICLWFMSGCGGHATHGVSTLPATITITPASNFSVQLGGVFAFTASARTGSGGASTVTFTYSSSDNSILNISPTGVACAGHWDASFGTCTPGNIGYVLVTAEALNITSPPTYVFVHPAIDDVKVTGILLNGIPIQEPCLGQGQSMTVEAHAYSQGADVTTSVGPFTWTANNPSVVKITPLVNLTGTAPTLPFATNQATVTAVTPGTTYIYATSSNVTSNSFSQPQYKNAQGVTSPLLDFFETCLIQNIALEVGPAGSQQTGQTSFITGKGSGEAVNAIVTDVMGNNSFANPDALVVLNKTPLTWISSNPAVIGAAATCTETCTLTTPSVGAAGITASCTPPACNIGYPQVPLTLSTPAALAACADFFQLTSCQQFIPAPVYSSPPQQPIEGTAALSGLVTGATGANTLLASSVGCENVNPLDCATVIYDISTAKAIAGSAIPLPFSPNSLLFDSLGDKAYLGSAVGGASVTTANLGGSTNPFGSVGAVTGRVLAVSNNGNLAVFADSNQVFVTNGAIAGSASVTPLAINQASAAGFSPDGLKAFIFGLDANSNPNLFVYSTLQAVQAIPLPAGTTVDSIKFSTNGAFAYVVTPAFGTNGPAVTVLNTCDNQIYTDTITGRNFIPLSATPVAFEVLPDGVHFIALDTNGTFDYITATVTGIPIATLGKPATSICPMTVGHTLTNINLNQGQFKPLNVFTSPDGSQVYVLASDIASVLVYNFESNSTSGILLENTATPLSGSITADGSVIAIAGSDGMLHEVSTALGGTDTVPPIQFPNLPSLLNPFCTNPAPTGPCKFNLLAVKP
jgi:hypothetical protein